MNTEYELTLTDYLSIIRRRAPYLIGTFVAVILASIIAIFTISPTYLASGTIVVESPQFPENVVPNLSQNLLDERINSIKQRVLTRDSLLRLANKYDLFKGSPPFLTSSELVERLRNRVGVEMINSGNMQGNRDKPTIAFTVSFQDGLPEIAYQVANDLISLFLDLNVKLRIEGATNTADFLTEESNKLRLEVERLEGLISAYKQKNSNTLPEQLSLRMTMLARAENDLREAERDYRSTKDELRSLRIELAAAKSGGAAGPSQLPEFKAELARLSGIYNESHPDIRALKRKIDALEKAPDVPEPESVSDRGSTLAVSNIRAKIESANARLESLAEQQKMLKDRIAQNENAMILTPRVQQELDVLIRDRDSAQKKYEEILNKKMSAKIAENMENENKSERFTLIDPPILPEKPFKPDRLKIIVLGFLLAIASSAGMLMAMVTFDRQVRGADALAHVLGHRPLAVIPYITIEEEEAQRKHLLRVASLAGILVVIAVPTALHFFYMPLDVLFTKIMVKLV